jgi:hypothetical protein
MKTIIFFLIFFLSHFFYGQTLQSIKEIDTIFIYFDHGKYQKKIEIKNSKINSEYTKNMIFYKFKIDEINEIKFVYNDYKDFDSYEKGLKTDVKIVKKKFLKHNKDKILSIDFFLKNGFRKTVLEIYNKKFYIIDSKEIKGRKVVLREVRADFDYYLEI